MGEKGIIVSGEFGNVCAREKKGASFELGELLIAENEDSKTLLQVFDLFYGSQLNQQNLELISGIKLEEDIEATIFDENVRNYVLARLKNVLTINKNNAIAPKSLPKFFAPIREVKTDDISFISREKHDSLFLGNLRSGSKTLEVPIFIDGKKAISHHILIVGTTGRGKSVLMSNLIWNCVSKGYCGMLVLDPHDEYYGRSSFGMKDHPDKVEYFSLNPPVGGRTLKINLTSITPYHLFSIFDWSDAQVDALRSYYNQFHSSWIQEIIKETPIEHIKFFEATISVIKRRILSILSLEFDGENIRGKGVFDSSIGQSTIKDIQQFLENGKTVIIDTSEFSGSIELLIGSIIANEVLKKYKRYSATELKSKPVISIVLEEAPRVLGKDVLEKGSNVFSTIAREGRKFNIGLTAITQLPSLIPREILANLNTKIILGIELKPERRAVIESSAQDLSDDERMISSLDKGEAIVTSNFLSFATPIKIPMFSAKVKTVKKDFEGFI
ncbi:ATP-binding protein [Nanoarchaeota archaeon]